MSASQKPETSLTRISALNRGAVAEPFAMQPPLAARFK